MRYHGSDWAHVLEERWTAHTVTRGPRGRLSSKWKDEVAAYCPLETCEVCGLLSGRHRVSQRDDAYGWDSLKRVALHPRQLTSEWWNERKRQILCTGCWNTARALDRQYGNLVEIGALVRNLERTIDATAKQGRENARRPAEGDR